MQSSFERPRDREAELAVIVGLLAGADLGTAGLSCEHFDEDLQPLVQTIIDRRAQGLPTDRSSVQAAASCHADLIGSLPPHDPSAFLNQAGIVRDLHLLGRLLSACDQISAVMAAHPPNGVHKPSPSRLRTQRSRR